MVFSRPQSSRFSSFLPHGPGRGNGTYQSTPKNVHASLSGTSLHFLRRSPRQTPITKFPRSPTSETWGFQSTRPSPRQPTIERLRIQQGGCCSWSKTAFIPLYCALVRSHLVCAIQPNAPTLRTDINQLEMVQRLSTPLVRALRHVPYVPSSTQLVLDGT